ncbi:amidohydrolase family protein [Gammaproteobacteria bacterium]|jgi:imidazolonepropionase-like amidohydrolase|nr:amidohydrolase family protein [Gammaproteobacteria bacterium]MDC1123546.1 amidohydrolase family protein [Gammaproteobacteria bacterium]MDC3247864.1 amidohydrolase family protein [Gammaproteobacteria bacterium]
MNISKFLKIYVGFCLILFNHIAYADEVLITNANIYDGQSDKPYFGNILIKSGKIISISNDISNAKKVINADGKIVTPGFIAPDTEIGIVEIGSLSVTRDDSPKIYNIGFSIFDAFNPNSTLIPWNRANGITSALSLPKTSSSPIGGLGSFFDLNSDLNISGEKDMVMIGRVGGSSSKSRAETFALMEDILDLAFSIDSKVIESDIEIISFMNDMPIVNHLNLQVRDMKALYKLANNRLPLIIESNRASDILKLIKLKKKYNLNLIIMGAQEATLVSTQIAESKIPLIVNPINNIPNSFDELASNINASARLEQAGISLMFNAPRDHNYHLIRQGAGVAVANGMSYGGAIKALTSNFSEAFGISSKGVLKKGASADLIIWSSDPLEPSSIPEKVFINGVDLSLMTRSLRLQERYIKNLDKPNTYR